MPARTTTRTTGRTTGTAEAAGGPAVATAMWGARRPARPCVRRWGRPHLRRPFALRGRNSSAEHKVESDRLKLDQSRVDSLRPEQEPESGALSFQLDEHLLRKERH